MKKIILGEKQFIGNQNIDNYIDIDLNHTIETIKKDSIENIFDFQQQFDLERNSSFKFCIYGMIQSRYGHCDNLTINVKVADIDGGNISTLNIPNIITQNTALTTTILSHPLDANGQLSNKSLSKNIYGTKKGCYYLLFELDKSELLLNKKNKYIFLEIYEPTLELYGKFMIPIIYFDEDKEIISFGTENAEIDENNDIIEINTNFPFLYDRHWVKLNLEPVGPKTVFFTKESLLVSEINSAISIELSLNQPSEYGLERCKIVVDYGVDNFGELVTTATIGSDFLFAEQIITWNKGEQIKSIKVLLINDLIVEHNIESIVFRILPLSNIRINPNEQYKFTLLIESDDIPSLANFSQQNYFVDKPQIPAIPGNPDNLYYNPYIIDIPLTKPVETDNQSIGIRIVKSQTTAIGGQDYFLVNNDETADELFILTPKNSTLVQLSINIIRSHYYSIDKFLTLELFQVTNNVEVGTTVARTKITIGDGILEKFVNYIIPFDLDRGAAAYKTIYNAPALNQNRTTNLRVAQPDATLPFVSSQNDVTHLFTCDLTIKNLGDPILFNNITIPSNGSFFLTLDFANRTTDFNIPLPTNLNKLPNTSYELAHYEMKFENFSKFYPSGVTDSIKTVIDGINDFTTSIRSDYWVGGDIGTKRKYLVTEIEHINTQYDANNDACLLNGVTLNNTIRYNGALFVPNSNISIIPGSTTSTKLYFSNTIIKNKCAKSIDLLPIGLDPIPAPPFNDTYAKLILGGAFVQDGVTNQTSNQHMRLGATNVQGGNSLYQYFRNWSATHIDTKTSATLKITNKGERDVTVLGKNITINEKETFDFNNIDFENMSLTLPTNYLYDAPTNSFKYTNYLIEFLNIRIYNNLNYTKSINKTLPLFVVTGNTIQDLPVYFTQTRYNYMKLPSNVYGTLDCLQNILNCPDTIIGNVYINDQLFFYNTVTLEGRTIYTQGQVLPSCPTSFIKYQIV